MNNVTLNSLKTAFQNYLQAQNSQINAFAINSMWDILSGSVAGSLLDLYGNLQVISNSIYPQNSVGDQVDQWLYTLGLSARGGLSYATTVVIVTSATPVTIIKDTIFSDSSSNIQYKALQDIIVETGSQEITLYALELGNNQTVANNTNLTSPSAIIVNTQSSTNGQLEETDQSCITRILKDIGSPRAGSRQTDYLEYALQANILLPSPVITFAIIIPSFYIINQVGILGVFPLVGTAITEYQLNQGLLPTTTFQPYSREAGNDTIIAVNVYIQSLRLVGLPVLVASNITSEVPILNVSVSLITEFYLTSIVNIQSQDINYQPITIQLTILQLIKREIRRAICNQPFGGVNIQEQNYITINSLIDAVNGQLNYINGSLVQVLTNLTFSIGDIAVPNKSFATNHLYYTYDIANYTNIDVIQE